MYSLSRDFFFFYHDLSNHSRMRFQHALIQFQRSHILLTLRTVPVAMSFFKYNTKWPFDLNNMSREMNKNYAMVWERYACQFILLMHFIFYKTSVFAMKNTILIVLLVTYNEAFLKSGENSFVVFSKHEKMVAIRKLI